MIRRMVTYGLFMAVVAAAIWWRDGAKLPEPRNLLAALLLLPLFAWVIWLRHDWAPAEYERKQAEKKRREASTPGATPPPQHY